MSLFGVLLRILILGIVAGGLRLFYALQVGKPPRRPPRTRADIANFGVQYLEETDTTIEQHNRRVRQR